MVQIKKRLDTSTHTSDLENLPMVTDFIINGLTASILSLMVAVDSEHIIILGGVEKNGYQDEGVLFNTQTR